VLEPDLFAELVQKAGRGVGHGGLRHEVGLRGGFRAY
jgi:hypothetical protein